jgi:hypothetical protein
MWTLLGWLLGGWLMASGVLTIFLSRFFGRLKDQETDLMTELESRQAGS